MKLVVLIVFLCYWLGAYTQLTITNGTTLTIVAGTTLSPGTNIDTISTDPGGTLINDGLIELYDYGYVNDSLSPITGSGYEHFSKYYASIINNINLGGLGYTILACDSNDINVERYHSSFLINGNATVTRYYIISSDTISQVAKFDTDGSELNGNMGNDLILASSYDNGNSWVYTFGNTDAVNFSLASLSIDSTAIHTLIDFSTIAGINYEVVPSMTVYPNPIETGNTINVMFEGFSDGEFLRIYTQNGQLMQSQRIQGQSLVQCNLSGLTPGIYLIEILGGSTRLVRKLMIQ